MLVTGVLLTSLREFVGMGNPVSSVVPMMLSSFVCVTYFYRTHLCVAGFRMTLAMVLANFVKDPDIWCSTRYFYHRKASSIY